MIAALFPGQGSQHVGMGGFLLEESTIAKQTFEEASDTLGFDMFDLCLKGPEDKLRLTENTQPALVTTSVATYRVVKEKTGLTPTASAGHSVGEYAALVAAGVFDFAKSVELVKLRGKLMQESVPVGKGGMLAVMGLDPSEVTALCEWAEKESGITPLEPANYNSPGQIVVSGNADLIKWVQENFSPDKINSDKKKVRLIPLKVSAPFHCSMMKTAETEMKGAIDEVTFNTANFGVAQNFTGTIETDPEKMKANLIAQISGPVRWVECVEAIKKAGATRVGEFGPGKVLTGLMKKIDPEAFQSFNFNSLEDLQAFYGAQES